MSSKSPALQLAQTDTQYSRMDFKEIRNGGGKKQALLTESIHLQHTRKLLHDRANKYARILQIIIEITLSSTVIGLKNS